MVEKNPMVVPGKLSMLLRKLSDFDSERKVAGTENVDYPVVEEPGVESQLLKLPGKLACRYPSLKN